MTALPATPQYDLGIIGGGIVGLATAVQFLRRYPDRKLVVLEAEAEVGTHQSGRNSGVLHSGVYYKPGSLKASLCRAGKQQMEEFCREHGVPFERCGKVIVATNEAELQRLDDIERRGIANGVELQRLQSDELRAREPAAAGIAALHVPEAGIVDYRAVCAAMRRLIDANGSRVATSSRVSAINAHEGGLSLHCDQRVFEVGKLVNCAGLQCDRILQLAGGTTSTRIIPFRGEYYELVEGRQSLCRHLIYPVPDPAFPFLGVHFTRMIGGGVECGPNAVLALAREGYRWRDIRPKDVLDTLSFRGFHKLAAAHWRMGAGEIWRSVNKQAFVVALQRLVPALRSSDLRVGRAGVRAQAVDVTGKLVDDFLIERTENAIHVLNAPSPAATASLAIAQRIVEMIP
ncbi:MAG: L-2-hydroxyglutarate oxidase [Planctomycetaceae bacterium]